MITWKHFYLRSLIASVFGLRGGGGYSQLLFLLLSDVRITILSLFGAKYYSHSVTHQHTITTLQHFKLYSQHSLYLKIEMIFRGFLGGIN